MSKENEDTGLCRLTWGDLTFNYPDEVVKAQGLLEVFYRKWREALKEEALKQAYSPSPGATFRFHHINTRTGEKPTINRSAGKVTSVGEAEEYVQRMNNETNRDHFYFLTRDDAKRIKARTDLLKAANFPYHRLDTDAGLIQERISCGRDHKVNSVRDAMEMTAVWSKSSPAIVYWLTPEDRHELRKRLGEF